jgi:general secretion pathway protein N
MPDKKDVDKLSFPQKLALFGVALLCTLLTAFVFAPVVWLSMLLQSETGGRVELTNPEGSLWNGSALVGFAVDKSHDLTPLLPGRFEWHLSPILLLGQIELVVENSEALQQPLYVTGNFRHIQINPNSLMLPASRLVGLGAPLNTIKPSGKMKLSWDVLDLTFSDGNVDINGTMKLAMDDVASALSRVKPLGSYLMSFDWEGQEAKVDLKTTQGPMLLSGKGTLTHGYLRFSGLAQAEEKQVDNLANLLNLLGQHRPGADKNVISLEFK